MERGGGPVKGAEVADVAVLAEHCWVPAPPTSSIFAEEKKICMRMCMNSARRRPIRGDFAAQLSHLSNKNFFRAKKGKNQKC